MTQKKHDNTEMELSDSSQNIVLSPWLKWPLILFFSALTFFSLSIYWNYIQEPKNSASPNELGLSAVLIFSLSATVILLLPWNKFGLKIKKIGIFEFEQVVAAQAAENAEDMRFLEERIESLEDTMRQTEGMHSLMEVFNEPEIKSLLNSFFASYPNTPISALRIRTWGATQPGFEKLSEYDHGYVRHILRKLVNEGVLVTKISKKGNTLYQLAEK